MRLPPVREFADAPVRGSGGGRGLALPSRCSGPPELMVAGRSLRRVPGQCPAIWPPSMCRIPPGTSSPTCARIETWDLLTSRLGGSLSWEAGASATGCSDPPRTKPVRFPPKPGTTRTRQPTDRSPRPPGARVAVPLPPGQAAAVTVRPIARLFPPPPAPLTVGRAGRAWPVPCRWPYRRLGGMWSTGSDASTPPAGLPTARSPARWAGAAVTG